MAYDYARRKEIARAKGFDSYNAYRRAGAQQREAATRRLAQSSTEYRGSARNVRPPAARRQQIFEPAPAQTVVVSKRDDVLRSQIRKGAGRDARVAVTMIVETPTGPRELRLFGRGGWDADALSAAIDDAGASPLAYFIAAVAQLYEGEGWAADLTPAGVLSVQVQLTD